MDNHSPSFSTCIVIKLLVTMHVSDFESLPHTPAFIFLGPRLTRVQWKYVRSLLQCRSRGPASELSTQTHKKYRSHPALCSEILGLDGDTWRRPPSPTSGPESPCFFLPKPCETWLRPLTHRRAPPTPLLSGRSRTLM